MATTVWRDVVARGEYKRFCLSTVGLSTKCAWCGRRPFRLYGYVWWADDKREPMSPLGQWFCNLVCFTAWRS